MRYNLYAMKIAVGMSGGVDSSVAALLLQKAGHDVLGLSMKLWRDPPSGGTGRKACYGPAETEDVRAAERVCAHLGIWLHIFDCSEDYETAVLRDFRDEYLAGRTPNPCVRCNRMIKFGVLPETARKSGLAFDRFATGHYARIDYDGTSHRFLLKKGIDSLKDQSYFLYRLSQGQLGTTLFPLGGLLKSRVREIARQEKLPVPDRAESQDFYDGDWTDLVRRPGAEGDIVDSEGRILGRHRGIWNYTVGQRKGLGLAASAPLYVVSIDAVRNRIVVGPESETYRRSCVAADCAWVAVERLTEAADVEVKIRSGSRPATARISPMDDGRVLVEFASPLAAVTPGQSAVFYQEDIVLGGGIIDSAAS
jgi:tRNA-specific 2-thiouridylase